MAERENAPQQAGGSTDAPALSTPSLERAFVRVPLAFLETGADWDTVSWIIERALEGLNLRVRLTSGEMFDGKLQQAWTKLDDGNDNWDDTDVGVVFALLLEDGEYRGTRTERWSDIAELGVY